MLYTSNVISDDNKHMPYYNIKLHYNYKLYIIV